LTPLRKLSRGGRAALRATSGAALESYVRRQARRAPSAAAPPQPPASIFVLRNNDVGDLLAVTPLFEALRQRFPAARIVAGVGHWNVDVLCHNPHLSDVLTVDAPWYNKYAAGRGPLGRLRYLRSSPQLRRIAAARFDVGIDVLGSAWGALLLLRCGIPYRLGVKGYAGGDSAAQATVAFDAGEHVGRTALRFAELLAPGPLPEVRPQLFLTAAERAGGEAWWRERSQQRRRRVLIAPGGGAEQKRWPAASFATVARLLAGREVQVGVLAGRGEEELATAVAAGARGASAAAPAPPLREAFAIIAASDLVVCNSSMPMHAAAAGGRPTLVVLGSSFHSAAAHQAQWGYPGLTTSLGQEQATGQPLAGAGDAADLALARLGAWNAA
jgi:heptosyltransferase-2